MIKHTFLFLLSLIIILKLNAQGFAPVEFVENKGQWDPSIKMKGDFGNVSFYLNENGYSIYMHNKEDYTRLLKTYFGHDDGALNNNKKSNSITLRSHLYRVNFENANEKIQLVPEKVLTGFSNYFLGNDPTKWASGCKTYQAFTYKNVYPGIDVRGFTENGKLKYEFIVSPGADANLIALKYEGATAINVTSNNELKISTSVGDVIEGVPYSFQNGINGKKTINCKYKIEGNKVKFDIKNYNKNETLVIDPTMVFASFVGSRSDSWGYSATYGPDGALFAGGIVFGPNFPVSPGAYQTTWGGGISGVDNPLDICIFKFNRLGTDRVYATFIGGSGNDYPHSLVVDNSNQLVIGGRTSSTNYPTTSTLGPLGGNDIIITKLNVNGTALIGSIKIGGSNEDCVNISDQRTNSNSLKQNYGEESRSEVIVDADNNVLMVSNTRSTDFPVLNAFQTSKSLLQDGVILKLNSNLSSVIWSTYFGGSGDDACYVINKLSNGNIYVAGGTTSNNLPGVPGTGVIQNAFQGGLTDGYISLLNDNGTSISLTRTSYLGTGGTDQVYGVQTDKNGFPYVMGTTTGTWPIVNATYNQPNTRQFIAKLQPDFSAYVYSTTWGREGSAFPNISPIAFLVDRCENVYVSGWGGTINTTEGFNNSSTNGLPITADALQSNTDGSDFFFFVLERNAIRQLYGSYYGASTVNGNPLGEHVDGGTSRFDSEGVIYQAICGDCGNSGTSYPTTPGVWGPTNQSDRGCNLLAVKIAFNLAGIGSGVKAGIRGRTDNSGCLPLQVNFSDTIANAKTFEWDFGDGSPIVTTTIPSTSHVYNTEGTFRVKLVSIDPDACNIRDSSYLNIRVRVDDASLDFIPTKLPPCENLSFSFTNTTTGPKPFSGTSFLWSFGDGSPQLPAGLNTVTHTYANPGNYTVRLILVDTNFCNAIDTIEKEISISPDVDAIFSTPSIGCAPYLATFTNSTLAGNTFFWDFGNGNTSTLKDPPPQLYSAPGTYTIKLKAFNTLTCNLEDSTQFTITVGSLPTAAFTFSPNPGRENTPTQFSNNSSIDVTSNLWKFGDGDSSRLRNPIHQYNTTGAFEVCLTVSNLQNCADTICDTVRSFVIPLVDVPSAFSPNGDGVNDIVRARGFGIAKLTFRIFNRQGVMVFESSNQSIGWDGKYKGILQPMDAYAYTVEAVFTDGKTFIKKGDVTLIR